MGPISLLDSLKNSARSFATVGKSVVDLIESKDGKEREKEMLEVVLKVVQVVAGLSMLCLVAQGIFNPLTGLFFYFPLAYMSYETNVVAEIGLYQLRKVTTGEALVCGFLGIQMENQNQLIKEHAPITYKISSWIESFFKT
jgi:hypothetical protein